MINAEAERIIRSIVRNELGKPDYADLPEGGESVGSVVAPITPKKEDDAKLKEDILAAIAEMLEGLVSDKIEVAMGDMYSDLYEIINQQITNYFFLKQYRAGKGIAIKGNVISSTLDECPLG